MPFALLSTRNNNGCCLHGENMKVLIVDDNRELASVIRNVVEQEQECIAETAHDGVNGYATYLHFRPDVIITDIEMSGPSGSGQVLESTIAMIFSRGD